MLIFMSVVTNRLHCRSKAFLAFHVHTPSIGLGERMLFFPTAAAAKGDGKSGACSLQLTDTKLQYLGRQALGELALFLPTSAAAKGDGGWGAWAPTWLDMWGGVAHCDFWDRQWMGLFARLVKHDTRSEHGIEQDTLGLSHFCGSADRKRRSCALARTASKDVPSRCKARACGPLDAVEQEAHSLFTPRLACRPGGLGGADATAVHTHHVGIPAACRLRHRRAALQCASSCQPPICRMFSSPCRYTCC